MDFNGVTRVTEIIMIEYRTSFKPHSFKIDINIQQQHFGAKWHN